MLKNIQMFVEKLVVPFKENAYQSRKVCKDKYGRYIVVDSGNNAIVKNLGNISNSIDHYSLDICRGYHSSYYGNPALVYSENLSGN